MDLDKITRTTTCLTARRPKKTFKINYSTPNKAFNSFINIQINAINNITVNNNFIWDFGNIHTRSIGIFCTSKPNNLTSNLNGFNGYKGYITQSLSETVNAI